MLGAAHASCPGVAAGSFSIRRAFFAGDISHVRIGFISILTPHRTTSRCMVSHSSVSYNIVSYRRNASYRIATFLSPRTRDSLLLPLTFPLTILMFHFLARVHPPTCFHLTTPRLCVSLYICIVFFQGPASLVRKLGPLRVPATRPHAYQSVWNSHSYERIGSRGNSRSGGGRMVGLRLR